MASRAAFGELVGYVVPLASGVTVDRTRGYWPIAIFGHVVNILAVPALAVARRHYPRPERTGEEKRGAVTVPGAQESRYAAVAHLVAPGALGIAYDRSIPAVIAICVGTQVLALAAAVPVFASQRGNARH